MSQKTWAHDGYHDVRRDNRSGNFTPTARETMGTGDERGSGECRARRPHNDFSAKRLSDMHTPTRLQSGETATHTAKERPRSKQKRPDAAIYVPRARRQQDRSDICPPECTIDPRQEQAARKPTVKSALYVPRMRRSQPEEPSKKSETQQSDSGHCGCYEPLDGGTSHATRFPVAEDSHAEGNASKHKTKREKGTGKITDEKTGRDVVMKDRKKVRSDELARDVRPGNVETSECGENDGDFDRSLCSDDAVVSISAKCAATDESGCASRGQTTKKTRVEGGVSTQAIDMGDSDSEFHNVAPAMDVVGQSEIEATEHSGNESILSDSVRLPGNGEVDVSCDHNGADVPAATEHADCANTSDSCGEQPVVDRELCILDEDKSRDNCDVVSGEIAMLETDGRNETSTQDEDVVMKQGAGINAQPDTNNEFCIMDEDKSRDNCAVDSGGIAMLETDGRNETSTPDEDVVIDQGAGIVTQRSDIEVYSIITHEKDPALQHNEENTDISLDLATNNCVVSVLGLTACPESTSQNVAWTKECLTSTVSDGDSNVLCSDSGNVADDCGNIATRNLSRECSASEVAITDAKERRRDDDVDVLDDQLKCEQDSETNGKNASNVTSNSESVRIKTSETGRGLDEETVCDEVKSESKMHVQCDVGVIESETDSNVQDGDTFARNETCMKSDNDDNKSESCIELGVSVDDKHSDGQLTGSEVEKRKESETAVADHREDAVAMDTDDEEEDSWDKLFDESGDALDPRLVEELTVAVGKVKVQKPQFDYFNFQPKELELDEGEYSHLVEIYDFPPDLITRDLVVAFQGYKDKGFDIKWVDDSHAIGIFSSSIAAQGSLSMSNPFMKVRPISQATRATKLKAKNCTELLQPYKERPQTTASVARNLVAGALGLATRVPREKREEERKRLREARAKKKEAKQQVVDVWEGRVGGCAMDEES